jgi:ubiquinone/menaquinone biosynthesis C-methylase UbiE
MRQLHEQPDCLFRGYEKEWQEQYGHNRDPIREYVIYPLLKNEIGDLNGVSLLDLGSGNGWLIKKIADYNFSKAVCLDKSSAFLKQAQASIDDSRVEFIEADINEPIKLADESFDHAFCIFVLNEMPNGLPLFQCMHHLLRQSGVAHIIMTHPFVILHSQWQEKYLQKQDTKLRGELDYKTRSKLVYSFTLSAIETGFFQYSFEEIVQNINESGLKLKKLVELRTDNKIFKKYPLYWEERFIPKYLYIRLEK